MATATIDIGTMIVRSPDIRGGRPRIAGTGVTVQRIAELFKSGMNPDEIASDHLEEHACEAVNDRLP